MMKRYTQKGVAHVALILAVIVIGTVGFVGLQVSKHNSNTKSVASTSPTAATTTVKASTITTSVPGTINTKSDVQKAIKVTDDSSIDIDLDSTSLNDDIDNF